jgi:wobble nucleotide-excising tRNase
MIKKIKSINNFAVFKDFDWDKEVRNDSGNILTFQNINVIYGRNYSGKTTLSRILRAIETGRLSDKFGNPTFSVDFTDGTQVTQTSLFNHGKTIRVFNEDFVRDNLRFITNPDESIKSFAILGDDNNKIEKEIEGIEAELGSKEEGKETGLYAQQKVSNNEYKKAYQDCKNYGEELERQLGNKATGREIGIKYKPERFGDQNYNIQKLKTEIEKVQGAEYQPPTDEQLTQYEKLISEKSLQPISPFKPPQLEFDGLVNETEALVTQKISESDKIEELVKNATLNRWVDEGRIHHRDKRTECAFCGNPISENRWKELDKHFDEESERLEKDIDVLVAKIETEKRTVSTALSIDKACFYSMFHKQLDELARTLQTAVDKYNESLEKLLSQLRARKEDILNQKAFERPDDASADLLSVLSTYESIRTDSNNFTTSLTSEQAKAKATLRLKEVSDYLVTIRYQEQQSSIEVLREKLSTAEQNKNEIEEAIRNKEERIASKRRELNDEEKGAKKVNEYLNNFFGHHFLSLEAQKDEIVGEESKRIHFEVTRGGKKAYHLSEGECSLLAFCYFLAKLDDVDTRDSKPIIWIDDPISSLDGNHIFFVYSLINAEVVSLEKFSQLFVSTHNLDFLKYLKRLNKMYRDRNGKLKPYYQKDYFVVVRQDKTSTIRNMPKYLKEYVTEFNYLFHQIYKCSKITTIDDKNYTTFYNFANNARKFLEIFLYYKYPDRDMNEETLCLFFGETKIPAVLTNRLNNEYSHLCGVFERGSMPVEVPEMQIAAKQIIERLKKDKDQYSSLLKSIGVDEDEISKV